MSFIQWRRIRHHHTQPYTHIKDTKSPVMHTTGGKDVFMWKSQRTSQQETKYIKTHTEQHKKLQRWGTQTPQKTGGTLDRQAGFFTIRHPSCVQGCSWSRVPAPSTLLSGGRVARSLVFCAQVIDRCLSFSPFCFLPLCHLSSSTYGFSLPLLISSKKIKNSPKIQTFIMS
jgi:hypothetical protein